MTQSEWFLGAKRLRTAIEKARDAGEYVPQRLSWSKGTKSPK